ncbi:uncharacterized protein LOC110842607 [Folsomia candida]|uniref:Uncharacterized protein n=1 Tax=Folsomia candida TaxID=158441 RepID=A0A226EST3_FOLCA|nr:uncharacterized protein LOC110842607 [Folsomia candida]OXA60227.1 hypothetical protein Fcan01_06239 [Folsomia candida]
MGSTVSICNNSTCILNMAMKQITPLYYENEMQPGQCIEREVGKVWFTLEAKLWNGENGYDTFQDIVFPITIITLTALTLLAGGIASASFLASLAGISSTAGKLFLIGKVIIAAGASTTAKQIVQDWVSRSALSVHGLYMGYDRTFLITGGPTCYLADGFQVVKYQPGDEFQLEYL